MSKNETLIIHLCLIRCIVTKSRSILVQKRKRIENKSYDYRIEIINTHNLFYLLNYLLNT